MKYKLLLLLLLCCVALAQSQSSRNSSFNLEAVLGLSFFNQNLVIINQEDLLPQEVQPENYYRFQLITKLNYLPLDEKWALGAHVGGGYESFKTEDGRNERISAQLFKLGVHTQYEFLKIRGIRPYVELGTNYNSYRRPQINSTVNDSSNYLKSYVDIGLRAQLSQSIHFSLIFKDVATYHSDPVNFENRNKFTVEPILREFLNFPHFSIVYTLD